MIASFSWKMLLLEPLRVYDSCCYFLTGPLPRLSRFHGYHFSPCQLRWDKGARGRWDSTTTGSAANFSSEGRDGCSSSSYYWLRVVVTEYAWPDMGRQVSERLSECQHLGVDWASGSAEQSLRRQWQFHFSSVNIYWQIPNLHMADVTERLRWLTRNQLGSPRAGSNPAICAQSFGLEDFFPNEFYRNFLLRMLNVVCLALLSLQPCIHNVEKGMSVVHLFWRCLRFSNYMNAMIVANTDFCSIKCIQVVAFSYHVPKSRQSLFRLRLRPEAPQCLPWAVEVSVHLFWLLTFCKDRHQHLQRLPCLTDVQLFIKHHIRLEFSGIPLFDEVFFSAKPEGESVWAVKDAVASWRKASCLAAATDVAPSAEKGLNHMLQQALK